jgi:hypothetical protein
LGLKLELIEAYPCKSKEELEAREVYWIRLLKPTFNKRIPLRTDKERYYENHEEEKQKRREWCEAHKAEINARRREIFSTPEGKARKAEYNRKYRDNHKEQLKHKKKEWSIKNTEKIKEHCSTNEFKQKRNERRRNTIHHCDVCNVDIKGDSSAFKTHCLRPCHIEKSKSIVQITMNSPYNMVGRSFTTSANPMTNTEAQPNYTRQQILATYGNMEQAEQNFQGLYKTVITLL